ncbi:MAG: hypothetical protein Q4G14_03720 [Paracoccus sp. (in: a-proteobacteria)]|uniref:hypothetical protein n=1 Tax=Paracoccus sp. TaxID=267 RepID=UPI0026DFCAF7|nr:hypothetical protein [Paracoccus sp. (in: a-proteobacteria)]MDO5612335.1 hypothetical protein [Paracoccus sp. (in: a-proteobacteria)]
MQAAVFTAAMLTAMPATTLAQAAADPVPDALSRVLSAVQADLAPDYIGSERALLVRSEQDPVDVDFYLFAGAPDHREGELILHVPGLAYAGVMAGQIPELELAGNGSLILHELQTAVGRHVWESALTLAVRNGDLLLAGWTYSSRDRVMAGVLACDWNLLTGDWTLTWDNLDPEAYQPASGHANGKDRQPVPVADWPARRDSLTAKCDPARH